MDKAIVVKNVTKKYKLYDGTKERLFDLVSPKKYGEDFYALANVDFTAYAGEVVGFIGINGSGKSTLSNIIAGIIPETRGSIEVNGQVSLIAVAAGLKNDLTGRDNIELKLLMLGFNKNEIKELEPDIIEFSELGKFIDQPVKSYSSGMKSRLGFSISVNVNPDILIIDEALSVGDKAFAEKSLSKMNEFKQEGKTMIFVSHSIGQMKQFCEKILWLEYGMVKDYGTVKEVIPRYESFLNNWKKMSEKSRELYKENAFKYQNRMLQGVEASYHMNIDDFIKVKKPEDSYVEKPVSLLGHIRGKESYVYENPQNGIVISGSKKYQSSVYYIKRKAVHRDEVFYLLSNEPSGVHGVVGWMKATDLSIHQHVPVDFDEKIFYINEDGKAFDKPWGGSKNCVFDDLSSYKGLEFKVFETHLVGKNSWYRGQIDEDYVWIHSNFLQTIP